MMTENLDTFLNDFGVPVSFGAVSGFGIFDEPDQVVGGLSISTEYSVVLKFSDFGALQFGDTITVDGTDYTAKEPRKMDDGRFMRVSLELP